MSEYYLAHHGIKGQRWGVRNGPPYPLNSKRHSSYAIRRNPKRIRSIAAMDERTGSTQDIAMNFAKDYVLPAAKIYVQYKVHEMAHRQLLKADILAKYKMSHTKRVNDLPRIKGVNDTKKNAKITNPDYPKSGSRLNCTFCTAAMAMREKGYDVKAAKTEIPRYTGDLYKMAFNAKEIKPKAKNGEDLINALKSNGNGSYGGLTVYWKLLGSHSIFWKNDNGKIRIFDGQDGEEYDIRDPNNSDLFKSIRVRKTTYYRFDNQNPTKYVLSMVEPV